MPKGNAHIDVEALGNLFGLTIVDIKVEHNSWGRKVLVMEVEGADITELGVALTVERRRDSMDSPYYYLGYQPL